MRDIKFRVWDKKYRTFEYNDSPDVFISTEGEVFEKDERVFGMESHLEYNRSDHYEIMQYTGLKDKNGQEIYEGDIVKGKNRLYENQLMSQKVVFFNGCYMFGVWNAHEYFNRHQEIEVIGNIYENPDLLAVSK